VENNAGNKVAGLGLAKFRFSRDLIGGILLYIQDPDHLHFPRVSKCLATEEGKIFHSIITETKKFSWMKKMWKRFVLLC